MELLIRSLIFLTIAGAGVYVLIHANALARGLQNLYVRQAQNIQDKKDFRSYLFTYNSETWKTPFAWFMFKAVVIFFGIWLLVVAYPIVFGSIVL
jgi:hypothetical protein